VLFEEWLRALAPAGQGGSGVSASASARTSLCGHDGITAVRRQAVASRPSGHILLALMGATLAKHDLRPGETRGAWTLRTRTAGCAAMRCPPVEEVPRFALYNADSVSSGAFRHPTNRTGRVGTERGTPPEVSDARRPVNESEVESPWRRGDAEDTFRFRRWSGGSAHPAGDAPALVSVTWFVAGTSRPCGVLAARMGRIMPTGLLPRDGAPSRSALAGEKRPPITGSRADPGGPAGAFRRGSTP